MGLLVLERVRGSTLMKSGVGRFLLEEGWIQKMVFPEEKENFLEGALRPKIYKAGTLGVLSLSVEVFFYRHLDVLGLRV